MQHSGISSMYMNSHMTLTSPNEKE